MGNSGFRNVLYRNCNEDGLGQTVCHRSSGKGETQYATSSNFFWKGTPHACFATVITQCSIVELYKLGPPAQQAVDVAKTFERRKCNHREAVPGDECIGSVVGQSQMFVNLQGILTDSQATPTSIATSLRVNLRL